MTDTEGETMGTSESITEELLVYVNNRLSGYTTIVQRGNIKAIANRIDERFSRELQAKQDEVDALRAKLDASIPMPVDAYGEPWTEDDYGKPFAFLDGPTMKILTELTPTWRLDGWGLIDEDGVVYPADRCHHVAPEPPESIDDVRRTVERGYTYRDQDVLCAIDRAYACGRRDGAGERA